MKTLIAALLLMSALALAATCGSEKDQPKDGSPPSGGASTAGEVTAASNTVTVPTPKPTETPPQPTPEPTDTPIPPTPAPPRPTDTATRVRCNPSYEGACLDKPGDYDCAGGSGNGPNYTGRVRVVGPDVYDLDRDGDGIGCE